jgi:protein-tyrosine-phosphatase
VTDPAPETTTFNILFVCTGNTCRSPLAAALAREELARRGWAHVQVASAGVAAAPGAPASRDAVAVGERHGLDLSGHASQPVDPSLVDWADLVLVMSPSHLPTVTRHTDREKATLLGDFAAGGAGEGMPVPDPFGGGAEAYAETFDALRDLVSRALDRLAPIVRP